MAFQPEPYRAHVPLFTVFDYLTGGFRLSHSSYCGLQPYAQHSAGNIGEQQLQIQDPSLINTVLRGTTSLRASYRM